MTIERHYTCAKKLPNLLSEPRALVGTYASTTDGFKLTYDSEEQLSAFDRDVRLVLAEMTAMVVAGVIMKQIKTTVDMTAEGWSGSIGDTPDGSTWNVSFSRRAP